jgi:O-antigen/teichoic acid export membrane protein
VSAGETATSVHKAGSLRRNTVWTTLGQMSTVGLQALYFVMISRTLGSYDYGLFVGVYSLVAVLSPYSTLGFGMVMLRDASRDPKKLAESWAKALLVLGMGSVLVTSVTMIASHFLFRRNLLLVVLCLALSEAFCARAIELAGQAFQALNQLAWTARFNALMGLARTLAALCLVLYCAHSGMRASVQQWTVIYTGFSFLSVAIALAVVHVRLVKPSWCRISRRECGEGLSFALSSSSFSIYNDIDKTMLASYGFVEAAGTYAAAYRIIEVATAPIRAVYAAAMPRIFAYGAEGSVGSCVVSAGNWQELCGVGASDTDAGVDTPAAVLSLCGWECDIGLCVAVVSNGSTVVCRAFEPWPQLDAHSALVLEGCCDCKPDYGWLSRRDELGYVLVPALWPP